jgi:voltage-gated potassium channel
MIARDNKGRVLFGGWEYFIQALIILNLFAFAFETLPNLTPAWTRLFQILEVGTVVIFSFEYALRVLLSKPRFGYALSFTGLIDLLAILPFFLSLGIDLRSARAIRLLRLFRLLKLARYNAAIRRLHRAFIIVKEELVLFGAGSVVLLYLASVGIYHFEREAQPEKFGSVLHSLWWSVSTLTTVGYGDVYPITVGGKVCTFFLMLTGMGVIAVPTGLMAAALSQARAEERSSAPDETGPTTKIDPLS